VDLVDDLCATSVTAALAANSPIRILVVDDDPISRRAIGGALQVSFKKPETAENGDAALALATESTFDLIFMDVQMPGMDGFECCSRIRQTKSNGETPIVFVAGQADSKTRSQVATCGGNGIIAKPFLTAEVTVKALTSAWRGRIEAGSASKSNQEQPAVNESKLKTESRRARNRRRDLQTRMAISH
jgi:two-component system sensor histidine kinase BarA